MTLSAGTRLGPYEILSPLGAGGMGEVYRARDTRLDRDVAVKVLPTQLSESADALARFEREAKAVAALSHANIVALHDFGRSDGTVYAVSELLEGETLRARLAEGAIPARKAVEYALQIAHGLAAAHEKGIVHRDLKPENVFVTKPGSVKILDFGLARQSVFVSPGEDTHSPTVARADGPRHRARHRRLHVARAGAGPARRPPLRHLFVRLHSLRAAVRPPGLPGESPAETMASIARDDPPELSERTPGIPPGLERIVRHCLEKSPEERFQSARDLAFDLDLALVDLGAAEDADFEAGRKCVPGWGSRRAAALLLAAGVGAGWLWAARSKANTATPATVRFQQLTDAPAEELSPQLSPDGETLLYVEPRPREISTFTRSASRAATPST